MHRMFGLKLSHKSRPKVFESKSSEILSSGGSNCTQEKDFTPGQG